MIDNRAVGKTISTLRQNRNMTQQQLAATLNVSHQAVSKWENGAALPDVQTLMDLTRLFGITMEQLLSGEVPQERMEGKSPLEEPIRDIGNFFNNIFNGIFQTPKADEPAPEDDGAEETTIAEEAPADEPGVERLGSPLAGKLIGIEQVSDQVFADKILGDGVAVIPADGKVYAPADGTVENLLESHHAVCLLTPGGAELLIHVGKDTVALGGKHFAAHVKEGDKVHVVYHGHELVDLVRI